MIAARAAFLVFFMGSFATLCIPASSQSLKSEPNSRFSAVIYGGHSLKGDGMGPYVQGQQETQVSGSFAFNLWCWNHTNGMSNKPDPNAKAARQRSMIFDLSHPVPGTGAVVLQTTWDFLARFHVFWKHDHENESMVYLDEIPIGMTVDADRAEMWPTVDGVQHVLQMGPWAMGEFSPRASLSGNGTTKSKIRRESADVWRFTAADGSIARLWDYSDIQKPIDKGLYYFDFDVKFTRLK